MKVAEPGRLHRKSGFWGTRHPLLVKRTAGPSASLGMTKGRAALTLAAVTEGWAEPQGNRGWLTLLKERLYEAG
jgi:hypothetical protein